MTRYLGDGALAEGFTVQPAGAVLRTLVQRNEHLLHAAVDELHGGVHLVQLLADHDVTDRLGSQGGAGQASRKCQRADRCAEMLFHEKTPGKEQKRNMAAPLRGGLRVNCRR